jgi:hypothetical protein
MKEQLVLCMRFYLEFETGIREVRVSVRCPWPILLYCRCDILKFVVMLNLYKVIN